MGYFFLTDDIYYKKHSAMKRLLTMIIAIADILTITAGEIIFANKEQQWELTDVRSNDDYTAIFCDITILSNRAGCMDAHTYDKRGSSIYIWGEFGRKNIVASVFEGNYEPWEMYPGHYEWNYFRKRQKGRVAHAVFYFPRVPAGVTAIGWHFDGGWADESAPSDKYRSPNFEVKRIEIKSNTNPTPHTGWTERTLKAYWAEHRPAPMEGIFNFISTSNVQYWGNVRHRLAVKKDGESYQIIYLHGSNETVWKEGELKGVFSPTTTKGIYKVDEWFLDNKTPSTADFYLEYNARRMTLYDALSYVETHFMKLYPAYDVEESDISPLYPAQPPTAPKDTVKLKGNGSGFFVSSDVLATNYHVVNGANKIEVVISASDKVATYQAKVLCADKVNDLALIQINDPKFSPLLTLPYSIASASVDVGTSIYTMGYPMATIMGQEIKITDGIISSKTGYEGDVVTYQISAPIQPGSSGGPMFGKDGSLIGVTSSGIPDANNVGYAIKSAYLNNLIDAAPIKIQNIGRRQGAGRDLPEQVKLFTPYVALILIY